MLKIGDVTLITMSEAVKQFGVSDETLRRAIRRNQLQAIRVSGRTLFKLEDVAQWKERYYRDYRAKAVRVRWERQRQRKAKKGEVNEDAA